MLHPVFICNYKCRVFSSACFPLTDPSPSQEIPGVGGTEIVLTQRHVLCWAELGCPLWECALPHIRGGTSRAEGGRKKENVHQKKRCDPPRHVTHQALPWSRQDKAVPGEWQGLTLVLHGLQGRAAGWDLVLIPHLTPFPQVHFTLCFGFRRG